MRESFGSAYLTLTLHRLVGTQGVIVCDKCSSNDKIYEITTEVIDIKQCVSCNDGIRL
jgi:Zn ribbon nucleic-acid-binding protein